MRDRRGEFGQALIAVITFSDAPERLAAYRDHLGLDRTDIALLADPERTVYRLLGAGRGSLRRVWSPGTLAMYARLLRRGRRLERTTEDTRQLGADAVVDRAGRLHRIWLPPGPDRRPTVDELLVSVQEAGRQEAGRQTTGRREVDMQDAGMQDPSAQGVDDD